MADNYRIGTGPWAKGKLSKLDRKRKKWSDKAHGKQNPQEFMEEKERKFKSKRTRSEKIADEVEDEIREIGGKKKKKGTKVPGIPLGESLDI